MPTPYIEKLSKEGKGSVESLEKKWDEAKAQAKKEGKADNYAYITSIFKNMIHAGTGKQNLTVERDGDYLELYFK